ncbi:MAG: hypothetical protein E7321_05375 [Clostridiales bacterium]|nr:hypothetical protein [Clostridiales bacterium]
MKTYDLTQAAAHCSAILQAASGANVEHLHMTAEYLSGFRFPELLHDNRDNPLLPGDDYLVITCRNGYQYYVNVTADSALTACAELFAFASRKL